MADVKNITRGEYIREKIVQAVIDYVKEHKYPPTVQEIADIVGLKSKSTVHGHILRLLEEGKLETDAPIGAPRALRVPGYIFKKEGTADDQGM